MLEGDGIIEGGVKKPSLKFFAGWLVDVYTSIPGQMVRNAWMKTGFEWFVGSLCTANQLIQIF